MAFLLHKTAIFPIIVYLLWKWGSGRSWRTIFILGSAVLVLVGILRAINVLTLIGEFDVLPLLGQARAISFSQREFFLEPYPLLTGRMAEILLSIVVLSLSLYGKWRIDTEDPFLAPQPERLVTLLLGLQLQHLLVYLLCSPLTVLAERMILYYDYVHAIAVGSVLILVVRMLSRAMWPTSLTIHGTRVILALLFLTSAAYIANRYNNIFHAESREIHELTHAERFLPYRSILE
jgi:hypothetical protein